MKNRSIWATIFTLMLATQMHAQNLNGYNLEAHYPFTISAEDTTQKYADATIKNAPFANASIFSNGIYIGNDTTGSHIQTPQISDFNIEGFALQLMFLAEEKAKPILVCGSSWRWLTISTTSQGKLQARASQTTGFDKLITSADSITMKQWHQLTITYDSSSLYLQMFLDGNLLAEDTLAGHFTHQQNFNFSNTHAGNGVTFHGSWKHLKVYNQKPDFAISEAKLESDFILFPNPATSKLSFKTTHNAATNFVIYNKIGQLLLSGKMTTTLKTIDISNWPAGTYFVSFATQKGIKNKPFVVIK